MLARQRDAALRVIERLVSFVAYHVASLVPVDQRRMVFGAWHGRRFADNPRHLFEFLAEHHPELDLVWSGSASVRHRLPTSANVRFVEHRSARAAWNVARARAVFVSHGIDDVAPCNSTGANTTLVYLGHGIAIKRMGSGPARRRTWRDPSTWSVWRRAQSFDVFVASSEVHVQKLIDEYGGEGAASSSVVTTGQPRCDFFLSERATDRAAEIRADLERRHGIPADRRIVTYMPTFRDGGAAFSFTALAEAQRSQLDRVLASHRAILVERSHFVDGVMRPTDTRIDECDVRDLSRAEDVDSLDLLLVTDVLITDYSGAYVDFLLLDRPIVHWAYDLADYLERDRGLYFDLAGVAGGPIVGDLDALLVHIDRALADPSDGAAQRAAVRAELLAIEKGSSCRAVSQLALAGSFFRPASG